MKVEVTDLSPVKKTMSIEVDAEEVRQETAKVLRGYARKVKVPGFRAGKVPLDIVRARFGKEVEEDVKERLVSKSYHDAAHEKGLRPLGDPTLEELNWEDGKPLTFKTTFEILPQFEVKSYKGIEVRRPSEAVEDAAVNKALEDLRQARATLVTQDGRRAATGDVVVADVEGLPEEGEAFQRDRMMIELGATDNLPAFNERLEGVEAGSESEFSVDYPKEYQAEELAGKTVKYKLKIHEVKARQVPELDDEFAKDLGDFEDLAALRARVREDLEARRAHEAESAVRQSLLDKILMENPIVLPEILVDEETRNRLEDMVRHLMQQGMDPSKVDLDWKELRKQQEEPARKSVHARLMLDAVARAESLEVSKKEIEERLHRDAASVGEKLEEFKKKVREHGGMELLKNQMLREKSLDYLTSVANIQKEENA